MNFQILDIDYINKKDGPIIRIFGKDELNKSVCCFVPNFKPYFYASVSDNIEAVKQNILELKKFAVVTDIKIVENYYPTGCQKSKQEVLKIYIKEPKNVPEIRSSIANIHGVDGVYETDGSKPYFYASVSDDIETVKQNILKNKDFAVVTDIEIVEKYYPIGYQKLKQKILKIYTKEPKNVPEIRSNIANIHGVNAVYETDILFKNRFLIDKKIHGMRWVSVEPIPLQESMNNGILCNYVIMASNITEIDKIYNTQLKYLSFDIECLPLNGTMPTPETSPIIMISFAFSSKYNNHDSLILVGKKVDGVDLNVETFEFEKDLLNRFFEILNDYDPDIITGYNINNFDIPYIVDRIDTLKKSEKDIKSTVGRDGSKMGYRSIMSNKICSIPGRIVFDVLPIMRKEFSLKQYTLQNVSKELLGKDKIDILPSEMEEHWNDVGEKIRRFINYARVDAELVLELVLKLQLLNKYIALSQVSGTLLQEVLDSGQSSMVENLMLREFGKRDRIISPKPDDKISNERKYHSEELKGGEVLEPEKGLLSNVLILDYKSLYPTIMMAHNLCYSTVIENSEDKIDLKDIIKSPTGGRFVSSKISKGIVPTILEDLLDKRIEVKVRMRDAKTKEEHAMHDATQYALKLLLNSFYGYSGYIRARLYSLTLANSVTSFGRQNILNTRSMVNDRIQKVIIKDGIVDLFSNQQSRKAADLSSVVSLSVVYGDTDSVFIQCKQDSDKEFSIENAELVGKKIAEVISETLPDPMEIEFESFAKNALFVAKKRYALWIFEQKDGKLKDKIKVKGMETIRRDWCNLTSKTIETVLEMILKKGAIEDAVKHVKNIVDKIRNTDFTKDPNFLDELTLTKRFSKSKKSYKSKQPHLTVVQKIVKRTGRTPPIGERIPFVIVAGKGLFVDRAEDPTYVKKHNIPIDTEYYVKKQILIPVERILGIVVLDYDSKQKGLFDFEENIQSFENEMITNNIPNYKKIEKNASKESAQKSLFEY